MPVHTPPEEESPAELTGAFDAALDRARRDPDLLRTELLPAYRALLAEADPSLAARAFRAFVTCESARAALPVAEIVDLYKTAVGDDLPAWERAVEALNASIAAGRTARRDDARAFARLVGLLLRADRLDDAFTWCERELAILRELLDRGLDAHELYAAALHRHAVILNGFGRYEESLKSSETAVLLRQVLARTDGAGAVPLADSLIVRQTALRELRRYDEALLVCHQAATIHRGLDHRTPHPEPVRMSLALREHARLLSLLGEDYALKAFDFITGRFERHAEADPALRAELAETLDLRLAAMRAEGMSPAQLLPHTERRLRLEEELAGEHPGARVTRLARALHDHAVQLSAAGRHRDAIEHSARAVAIHIRLPAAQRALRHHLADYAATLGLHAGALAEIGRTEQALDFSAQALEVHDELLAEDRGIALRDTARVLERHAVLLEALDRRDEAAEHSARAVVLLEELIADGHPRDRQNLAAALSGLAARLGALGRVPEAVTAAGRALRIREDLAAGEAPERRADLGVCMLDLAALLTAHGDRGTGISYSSRAIAVLEELTALDRAAHLPLLARARHDHAGYLAAIGRPGEAAACAGLAVAMREETGNLADLTDSLHLAVRHHRDAGLSGRALAHAARREEVLELRHTAEPELVPDLAEGRLDLARLHARAGHRAAAVAAAGRAVDAAGELASDDREQYSELLEACLTELARALRAVASDDACEVAVACLEIAEERGDPAGLVRALGLCAGILTHAGRHHEALAHSARAISLREESAEADAPAAVADLASCHTVRAASLAAIGHHTDALVASTLAVALLRDAVAEDPDLTEDLALALREHALRLHQAARDDEAAPIVTEAVRLHAELAAADLRPHRPELAATLLTAAVIHADDATALTARAVALLEAAEAEEPGPCATALARAREELARLGG